MSGDTKFYKFKQFKSEHSGNYSCVSSLRGEYETYSEETKITTISRGSTCKCKCPEYLKHIKLLSPTELQEKTKKIEKELIVKTSNISAVVRKKVSSLDQRASSGQIGMGITIAIFSLVFGPMLVIDLSNAVLSLYGKIKRWVLQRRENRNILRKREEKKQKIRELMKKRRDRLKNIQQNDQKNISEKQKRWILIAESMYLSSLYMHFRTWNKTNSTLYITSISK